MINQDGRFRLIHGDCIQAMNMIADKSVDMIFTDLPYGSTNCKWDSQIPLHLLWQQYERIIKDNGAILLFAQTPFDKVLGASNLKMLRYEWIWEKPLPTGFFNAKKMPMKAHENILVFYKKLPTYHPQMTSGHKPVNSYTKTVESQNKSDIYGKASAEVSGGGSTQRYPRDVLVFSSDRQTCHLHETQKPVALCEYMIRTYTDEGNVVLDSCMGSGTTGVAALNCNRQFIGIEKNDEIYRVAVERILEATG